METAVVFDITPYALVYKFTNVLALVYQSTGCHTSEHWSIYEQRY